MIVRFTSHSIKRSLERLKITPIKIFNKMMDGQYIEVENDKKDGNANTYYVYSEDDGACIKLVVGDFGDVVTVYKDYTTKEYSVRKALYNRFNKPTKNRIVVFHYIFKDNIDGDKIYIKGDTFVDRYIANNHIDLINSKSITANSLRRASIQLEGNKVFRYKLYGIGIKTVGGKHTVYLTDSNKYYGIMEEKAKYD